MTAPFIWVGTYAIKPGKLETARKRLAEVVDLVEANEPRLIAFNFYLDEAGTTASCVQVHPDATSMVFHMEVIAEHLETAGSGSTTSWPARSTAHRPMVSSRVRSSGTSTRPPCVSCPCMRPGSPAPVPDSGPWRS